ncbi:MAG: DUF4198 domain-containing protein [Rhodocyclaceae bacterium]|nr:DUF4198 domain-containing protein [Rhodocyclaceae bacterium]
MNHRKPLHHLFAVVAFALAGNALAHDAWIEARGAGYVVLYGHGDKQEGYAPAKVKTVTAIDAKGAALPVTKETETDSVRVMVRGRPALATVHFDNGFWSKTTDGSKNLPKNEVPGAISAMHSVKFGKTVFAWSEAVTKPQGLQLEIVPLVATTPAAGKPLPVQILWEGKPLAGAKIVRSEYSKEAPTETDAEGKATLPVVAGRQTLAVSHKHELANDARADSYTASANLIFDAR